MKDKTFNLLKTITLIALFFCLIGLIYAITIASEVSEIICAVDEILIILLSYAYFFKGAKKDAAKYFRLYMLFTASSYVIECFSYIFSSNHMTDIVRLGTTLILYGNCLLLGASKDLGKKVSLFLGIFNLINYFIGVFLNVFFFTPIYKVGLMLSISCFVTTAAAVIMIIAKYKDKEARGAK